MRTAVRPAPPYRQNDWESLDSRNSPSLAVGLNCGMGSSSLNAEVNAFERTPDRPRPEFLVHRFEIEVMDGPCEVFRRLQFALHKCLVEDHLGSDVRQFTSLPSFDLISHRFEVSLHSINTNRDAIDERKRLRVFCEHESEPARDNVSRFGFPRVLDSPEANLRRAWPPALQVLDSP